MTLSRRCGFGTLRIRSRSQGLAHLRPRLESNIGSFDERRARTCQLFCIPLEQTSADVGVVLSLVVPSGSTVRTGRHFRVGARRRWRLQVRPAGCKSSGSQRLLLHRRAEVWHGRSQTHVLVVPCGSDEGVWEGGCSATRSDGQVRLQVAADQADSKHIGNSRNRGGALVRRRPSRRLVRRHSDRPILGASSVDAIVRAGAVSARRRHLNGLRPS